MAKDSKTVRIEDVAKSAGVSPTTVSYVLNNRGNVSEPTRQRVLQVARELQYRPNLVGRGLASNKAQTIGILMPRTESVSDPFFTMLASGFMLGAQRRDYQVALLSPDTTVDDIMNFVKDKRVDGILLLEVEEDDARVKQLYLDRIPLLLFGRSDLPVAWLDVDNLQGGMMATRHLLELGHKRIAHIAAPQKYLYGRMRAKGYEETLRQGDASFNPIIREGDLTMDAGYRLAREMLVKNPRPTAIFAGSDLMAIGAIRAATDIGLQVPRDLSVVGFDDSPLAHEFIPALTTIAQQPLNLGQRLAERLIRILAGDMSHPELLMPQLIVRESTAVHQSGPLYQRSSEKITLKSGPSYSLWSDDGFVERRSGNQGIYGADTHWLSNYMIYINGIAPKPASVDVGSDQFLMRYVVPFKNGSLAIERLLRFSSQSLVDQWSWKRWGKLDTGWVFEMENAVDFRDVFEMRGFPVESHGTISSEQVGKSAERHRYHGRDDRMRMFSLSVEPIPAASDVGFKQWLIDASETEGRFEVRMKWELPPAVQLSVGSPSVPWPEIEVENVNWQRALKRARDDVDMLQTDFGQGPVLMAGLPWFGALFGRDAILSSYQLLAFRPDLAENTLATMAHFQGQIADPKRSEMPGKMVHEVRFGELANLGVVPFSRYYGSVDVTPLFVVLVYELWRRQGSRDLLEKYLPTAREAMKWLAQAMQHDTNGLLMFHSASDEALSVQSWKDSPDSMVYSNAETAEPPLAVAEVQGYVFQAFQAMATLEEATGNSSGALEYLKAASKVQQTFHRHFWMSDKNYYAMAVDRHGTPLDVISSDPGQCLWTGVIPEVYRERVADRLMENDLFSGWGIRTLGDQETAYDPYSYHRGSVWPHDTAMIVAGLSRSGFFDRASIIANAMIEAANCFPAQRMPELFSGIPRTAEWDRPMPYPFACAPQAWAAGAVWLMFQSLLKLNINAREELVSIGTAPPSLGRVVIRRLRLPDGDLSLDIDAGQVKVLACPQSWKVVTV